MNSTEEDVRRQIDQMISFIKQEANEKAEEIETKAEEEFQIEKGRIVQSQRHKIQEYFEKKEKSLNQQKLVQHSHMLNTNRLKVLQARDDEVNSVIEATKARLGKFKDDPTFIKDCILQSLLQVLESEVTIRCLESQVNVVEGLCQQAANEYEQYIKAHVSSDSKAAPPATVKITVDKSRFLPEDRLGGVVLIAMRNRLTIDNTLVARCELIAQQWQPKIRNMLFGKNPNRRFDN